MSMSMSMPPLLQVGVRYEVWQPAGTYEVPGKGEFPQQYAPHAFDGQVGKVIPLTIEDRTAARVRIISAEVAGDGSGVTLAYEIVDLA